jgi:hypothetical protein
MTVFSSYVISLLANLNARGHSSSEMFLDDIATPRITSGSTSRQHASRSEGGVALPTFLPESSIIDPRISVVNITVHQDVPAANEDQNVTVKTLHSPLKGDIIEV